MAYFDNKLCVNAIRHAWLSADDTGLCETMCPAPIVLPKCGALPDASLYLAPLLSADADVMPDDGVDKEREVNNESPDIPSELGTGRMRSNTAVQLEQLRQQKAAAIKKVSNLCMLLYVCCGKINNYCVQYAWRDPPEMLEADAFPIAKIEVVGDRTSLTMDLLAQMPVGPENPFQCFSKMVSRVRSTTVACVPFHHLHVTIYTTHVYIF